MVTTDSTSTADVTVTDVACTRCACVCDDLTLTVRNNRIVDAVGSCPLSHDWLLAQNSIEVEPALLEGQSVPVEHALKTAAAWLTAARSPLIYGLSGSSTPGQRAAVALADLLGASIDTTASEGHAPSLLALQQSGESTCSLGEVRHRCDLVIYWGADPVETHPRHLERYSYFAKGQQTPRGADDRTLVVVDHRRRRNRTAELTEHRFLIEDETDFDLLWALRMIVRGEVPGDTSATGLLPADVQRLAQLMLNCRSGVVFFGYGLARQPLGHRVVEALLRLVTDLNQKTRFYARRLRVLGDVAGADNVLCWQTGYPFAVHLGAGFPRFNPGEFSAAEMLARKEVDCALLVGSDRLDHFSDAALAHLATIPTILLDSPLAATLPTFRPRLRFHTATYGIHLPGTAYRMDDVPVPLRASLTTLLPSDAALLSRLHELCQLSTATPG